MARQHSTTLLALVQAVNDYARSDTETVATIAYLINSGTVRLCGTFAGARIDLPAPASTVPPRSPSQRSGGSVVRPLPANGARCGDKRPVVHGEHDARQH
jgi:hypothetical protein